METEQGREKTVLILNPKTRKPLSLVEWQGKVYYDQHQFIVIVAGGRSGKTVLSLAKLITKAWSVKRSMNWYVAPTYGMAKDIAWSDLKAMLSGFKEAGYIKKINESDLSIEFILGQKIHLKGADKPDSLRGVGLDFLVLDEYATMKRAVWDEVLRPRIIDREGKVIFIGTPKGFNHFHDLYQKELKFPNIWKSFHCKTVDNPHIPRHEIEQAKKDMDDRAFKQEFEASFETFGGQVFPTFDRTLNGKIVRESVKFENDLEFNLGMDFGWSNPTATLFIQVDDKEDVFIFDELMATETRISEIGNRILKREYKRDRVERTDHGPFGSLRPLKHLSLSKPDYIYCDPSGDAKSEAMGTSSVEELRKSGFNVRYVKTYPGVIQDGVNTIRKWLQNGKIFIHPRCTNIIRAFEMYRYPDPKEDIQSEVPLKDGISDHWIDALRYFFLNRFPHKGANWEIL